MNNFHLLKGVSTVVAALGLALALGAAPALADAPDPITGCHPSGHKLCEGVAENRAQTFEVQIIAGTLATEAVECLGSSKRKQVTDAKFPPEPDCMDLTFDPEVIRPLHLCAISLNHRDRPDMSMTAFFTTRDAAYVGGVLCADGELDDVYQGEYDAFFDTTFDRPIECNRVGATCVTIDEVDFVLVKTTHPGKGDPLPSGLFSILSIVWDPL